MYGFSGVKIEILRSAGVYVVLSAASKEYIYIPTYLLTIGIWYLLIDLFRFL